MGGALGVRRGLLHRRGRRRAARGPARRASSLRPRVSCRPCARRGWRSTPSSAAPPIRTRPTTGISRRRRAWWSPPRAPRAAGSSRAAATTPPSFRGRSPTPTARATRSRPRSRLRSPRAARRPKQRSSRRGSVRAAHPARGALRHDVGRRCCAVAGGGVLWGEVEDERNAHIAPWPVRTLPG